MEHFSDVVNCKSDVSVATLDALPVVWPPFARSDDVFVNELTDNLTEEEIGAAISIMQKRRASGLDGISAQMYK